MMTFVSVGARDLPLPNTNGKEMSVSIIGLQTSSIMKREYTEFTPKYERFKDSHVVVQRVAQFSSHG
jgi:hypothetical protein